MVIFNFLSLLYSYFFLCVRSMRNICVYEQHHEAIKMLIFHAKILQRFNSKKPSKMYKMCDKSNTWLKKLQNSINNAKLYVL